MKYTQIPVKYIEQTRIAWYTVKIIHHLLCEEYERPIYLFT